MQAGRVLLGGEEEGACSGFGKASVDGLRVAVRELMVVGEAEGADASRVALQVMQQLVGIGYAGQHQHGGVLRQAGQRTGGVRRSVKGMEVSVTQGGEEQ